MGSVLKSWLPLALITTALCGLVYVAVQQDMRQGANDPQIQLAEDIAGLLGAGQNPQAFLPQVTVDIASSLGTYISIYNQSGEPIGSSAILAGTIPKVPLGSLTYAKEHGENRITWQPRSDVRSAIVIVPYNGKTSGYVVVGRSLREVEVRENRLTLEVAAVWIATLVITFCAVLFLDRLIKKN